MNEEEDAMENEQNLRVIRKMHSRGATPETPDGDDTPLGDETPGSGSGEMDDETEETNENDNDENQEFIQEEMSHESNVEETKDEDK